MAREREVLTLLAKGLTGRRIGRRVWLTLKTVETRVHHILGQQSSLRVTLSTTAGCLPSSSNSRSAGWLTLVAGQRQGMAGSGRTGPARRQCARASRSAG